MLKCQVGHAHQTFVRRNKRVARQGAMQTAFVPLALTSTCAALWQESLITLILLLRISVEVLLCPAWFPSQLLFD